MDVLLKMVQGMQTMQEMMLKSKEEGNDDPEVVRVTTHCHVFLNGVAKLLQSTSTIG